MSVEKKSCQRCGAEMSSQNAGGLCPRCLMAMNFDSQTMPHGEEAVPMPPLSPEELAQYFPQFEILECLGRGGMGVVYKARQKALERTVALKLLAGEWQGDVGFAERFEKEAKTLAQMSHPNIVTIHDFGEAGGHYYIVKEFVDGVNLRDLLGDGKMEPEQALAIVPPICEALEYAHEKGVVHRDIKPENLLLDQEGRVKIADFGIASLVGSSGEKAGTPPYMAPEQSGAQVDKRADIYALGVVLYEMLTGERPTKDLVSPSQKVELDVRLDEMVLRALEKDPDRRYQTAGEFRTQVETMVSPIGEGGKLVRKQQSLANQSESDAQARVWFRSLVARRLSVVGWVLGCLGFLGFLGELEGLSKWKGLFGMFGFFGLIGVAQIVEICGRAKERASEGADGLSKPKISRELPLSLKVVAALAFFFGVLSGLIPTLFYWLRPWAAPWLTDEALNVLLKISGVAAVVTILLGVVSKRSLWGKYGLIMGSISLVIWLPFFFAGQLSKPADDGGGIVATTGKDAYGRVYEARGGAQAMVDVDGDSTIFHIDADVLRFEEEVLQLNGYQVASLPDGIENVLIEKKNRRLKVFVDEELLLSQLKTSSLETDLQVSDQFSLTKQESFGVELEAFLMSLEDPKLLDLDDEAVRLFRISEDLVSSVSSGEDFVDLLFKQKGADFFVEKVGGQWGIAFPQERPVELARIPTMDWRQVKPSQIPAYLSNPKFKLEGHDNGPFRGLYLPFVTNDPVYLAFRSFDETEGVMEVTESLRVNGLVFRLRYSPVQESSSAN